MFFLSGSDRSFIFAEHFLETIFQLSTFDGLTSVSVTVRQSRARGATRHSDRRPYPTPCHVVGTIPRQTCIPACDDVILHILASHFRCKFLIGILVICRNRTWISAISRFQDFPLPYLSIYGSTRQFGGLNVITLWNSGIFRRKSSLRTLGSATESLTTIAF